MMDFLILDGWEGWALLGIMALIVELLSHSWR
jgi:hypothetical protein